MNRTLVSLFFVATALASVVGGVAGAATSETPTKVFDPLVGPPARSSVIIAVSDQQVSGDAQLAAAVLDLVYGDDVETRMALDAIDVIAADVTPTGLAILRRLSFVKSISVARTFELALDTSVPQIGVSTLHDAGIKGAGKVVAVIDSGVDSSHPGLSGAVVSEACFVNGADSVTVSGTGEEMTPQELCRNGELEQVGVVNAGLPCTLVPVDCSHGTSVAGIIAGSGPVYVGVAPEAGLISIRVTAVVYNPVEDADETYISELGVLNALNHVLTLSTTLDIAAVNLSLGGPAGACQSSLWDGVVNQLAAAGVAVVAASGNGGSDTEISFPACLPDVVSVGSSTPSGQVSDFTDSSSLLDLVAPGEPVISTVPGTGYASADGTSFSAPHVAGAYALLQPLFPTFGIDRLRNLLRSTGEMTARTAPDLSGRIPRFPEIRVDAAADFVPFVDAVGSAFWVAPSDWAKATGISTGLDGVTFGHSGTLTRGQGVTFLWRLMGRPSAAAPAPFTDLVAGKFYVDAVAWAAETGVTTGIGGNLFDPEGPVTRGQVATFMWRLVGNPLVGTGSGFVDVDSGKFYADAVDWMAANKITVGTSPSTFSPDRVVDRAQMVTFLQRLASTSAAWPVASTLPPLVLF